MRLEAKLSDWLINSQGAARKHLMPLVIDVAVAMEKVEAILAALRGQCVNLLVTDAETARAVRNEAD